MSACLLHHEVNVANLEQNEVIGHQLIVIRGIVNEPCSLTTGNVLDLDSGLRRDFQLTKANAFKVLWNLQVGVNRITINYCAKTVHLNLFYRETENQYRIQPLYIVCQGHDGHFNDADGKCNDSEEACRKIALNLQLVQCLYAEKILEHGLGRKTFSLQPKCQIFASKLSANDAKQLDENLLWSEFGREILNSEFGEDEKLKFIAFIGCTEYEKIANGDFSYENIKRHTKAHANLGGGGLALFGSGYLYCWPSRFKDILPCFEDNKQIDLEQFLDDSNYRRTYGGCYATTIGAVCHELGHIFDLGHTEEGIMGSGFDYINLVFTSKQLTESLPHRIVDNSKQQRDSRLTTIRKPGNFLQKYHEQKSGDSTFFAKNCAIILSLHRWINTENARLIDFDRISFDPDSLTVACSTSYLRLVEIRDKQSNLVVDYLDLSLSTQQGELRRISLTDRMDRNRHSLFVITSDGSTKYFA